MVKNMGKKILVIGSSNTDMTIKAPRIPQPGETILGGEFKMGPGGKGANQAVAAARLGGKVSFVCKVGHDVFGEKSVEGYIKEGIDTSNILYSDKASGTALIMVDNNGENCISVAPGANGDITPEDIEGIGEIIKEADYVVLQLEIPVESVVTAAKIAHESGAYVILNPAPACKLPAELFKYVSLATPNQTEIALMTGIEGNIEAAMKKLNEMGVKDIILTLGSRGSAIWDGERAEIIPAKKVKAVDATAAGDTFCGALCVALSEGKSKRDAVEFATKASALTVQKMGAQESIPYRKDIE